MIRKTMQGCLLAVAMLASMGAGPRDALARARQLYNALQYDAAIAAASEARQEGPRIADAAALVLARAYLERFRQTSDQADLTAARDALTQVRPGQLTPDDRAELMVGIGESLYFDNRPGAAAEEFELALSAVPQNNPAARERVLDWWAGALDRQAMTGPVSQRRGLYGRIVQRMEEELRRDPASAVASYWLVAGARGAGNLERAWDAAIAAWVRASLAGKGYTELLTDLDRIVTVAIIPERSRQGATAPGEAGQATIAMRREWDLLKQVWTNR